MCVDLIRKGIADGLAGIEIQNNCQVDEGHRDPNIREIRNPDLIDPGHHLVLDQVRIDGIGMIGVGGLNKSTASLDPQSPLSHDPLDLLVVHEKTLPTKLGRNLPVPIPGKLFGNLLYPSCQRLFLRGILRRFGTVIIAAPREVHELAPPRDGFEQVSVVGKELPLLLDGPRVRCKALFKNSFSRQALPSICSSWRIRSSKAASRLPLSARPDRPYCLFQ